MIVAIVQSKGGSIDSWFPVVVDTISIKIVPHSSADIYGNINSSVKGEVGFAGKDFYGGSNTGLAVNIGSHISKQQSGVFRDNEVTRNVRGREKSIGLGYIELHGVVTRWQTLETVESISIRVGTSNLLSVRINENSGNVRHTRLIGILITITVAIIPDFVTDRHRLVHTSIPSVLSHSQFQLGNRRPTVSALDAITGLDLVAPVDHGTELPSIGVLDLNVIKSGGDILEVIVSIFVCGSIGDLMSRDIE